MNNVLFQNFQSYNEFDLMRNEGFYQRSGLRDSHIYFKIFYFFFVISMLSVEKLVSVEVAPSASLREGK